MFDRKSSTVILLIIIVAAFYASFFGTDSSVSGRQTWTRYDTSDIVDSRGVTQAARSYDTHWACVDMSCQLVEGYGTNECGPDTDCYHRGCLNGQLVKLPGGGPDTAQTDFECAGNTRRTWQQ